MRRGWRGGEALENTVSTRRKGSVGLEGGGDTRQEGIRGVCIKVDGEKVASRARFNDWRF